MLKFKLVILFTLIGVLEAAGQASEHCAEVAKLSAGNGLPAGSLVIVGGGLEQDNAHVFNRMIELAGGADNATFAVIPSASGVAVQSFVSFRNELISYGVKPGNIHLIKIAVVDDDSTTDADESTWRDNGNNESYAEIIRKCSCVWFTGGDQLRTTKALYRADGSCTPVLEAVWQVFLNGGVIGGTSAGAAIMSDPMIGAGNSIGALNHGVISGVSGDDFDDNQGVLVARGLGFFPLGMVDQHFEARSRIGRFIITLLHYRDKVSLGFGIDENTALIYVGKTKKLEVAGVSGVTMINTANSRYITGKDLPKINNLLISYLEDGDTYDLVSNSIVPEKGKTLIAGNEKYNIADPLQTSMILGSAETFRHSLTDNLLNNKGTSCIENLNFIGPNKAYLIRLSKTGKTRGYYNDGANSKDHYTIIDVNMDLEPVNVEYHKSHKH